LRLDYVKAGMKILNEELARIAIKDGSDVLVSRKKKAAAKPKRQTFLFGGYMVDYPSKSYKAFPKDKEAEVRAEIMKRLEKFNASENDRASLPGLAAGSQIIFAELCLERGMHLNVNFPLPDSEYIREFVSPCGDEWVERFYKVRNHPLVEEHHQLERLGPPKEDDDVFERNNRWAVYSSLQRGVEMVRLIALWDGKNVKQMDRDARLVKHIVDLMRDVGGQVEHINSAKFMQVDYMDKIFNSLSFPDKPEGKSGRRQPK
jgi:hypothetical protein